ncbi:ornithine carbamoyltransferase [Kribbia dieselivorans]|uniref:ornithine carbamoyltransferase n=1 Tax=Kribbia dieselivorans TaxID=331526 RepID=UPI000837EB7B|nr:ornithine carbamoyltransferase [Kribbia dieselivorans]
MTLRHFLRDDDITASEQAQILDLALELKASRHAHQPLAGPRAVALIFDKPTLRTQLSFATGVAELGGYPVTVDGRLAQIGERESISDTAKVLGRQVRAIVWRTAGQDRIQEMAANAGVPVVNALTDDFHPCQILADLLTLREHLGDLPGQRFTYLGDGANNMAHSYLLGGALAGLHVTIATPASHQPDPAILARAAELAAAQGGSVTVTDDPVAAVAGARAVATDTWVSMGMESEKSGRTGSESPFVPFTVTAELMATAAPDAVFLHCLPAYRGVEVTAEVIDGPQSVVWDEAENRLHAQKALLTWLLTR